MKKNKHIYTHNRQNFASTASSSNYLQHIIHPVKTGIPCYFEFASSSLHISLLHCHPMSPTSTKPAVVENYSFGVNVHLKRVNTPNWRPCWGFQSLLYFEFKYFSLKTNTLDISNKINKEDKDLYIYFHLWLCTSLQLLSGLICWLDRGGRRGQGSLQFFSSLSSITSPRCL